MMIHLVLTFIDLLLLLCFTSSRKSSIHYDVTDVLNFISDKNYEFSEWALAFVFLFIIIPSTSICVILVSFKMYTHDFIKPIQQSYLTVIHSYITCLLLCKLLSDFILNRNYNLNPNEDIKLDFTSHIVATNLISFILFLLLFIPAFFLLEAKLASHLNSVPLESMGLLKKNSGCIIFSSIVFLGYSLYLLVICMNITHTFESYSVCSRMLMIGFFTSSLTTTIFYISYLKTTKYFTNITTRIYRDYIAI